MKIDIHSHIAFSEIMKIIPENLRAQAPPHAGPKSTGPMVRPVSKTNRS
jgi:hypothetical protein